MLPYASVAVSVVILVLFVVGTSPSKRGSKSQLHGSQGRHRLHRGCFAVAAAVVVRHDYHQAVNPPHTSFAVWCSMHELDLSKKNTTGCASDRGASAASDAHLTAAVVPKAARPPPDPPMFGSCWQHGVLAARCCYFH